MESPGCDPGTGNPTLEPGGYMVSKTSTTPEEPNWEHIKKCLGFKPLDICQKTLDATTQYARTNARLPLRDHYISRFSALNVKQLLEVYCTDTFFSSEKALGGYTCAQIYVGKKSYLTAVFGMQQESSMPETLIDFYKKMGGTKWFVIR